MLDVTATVPSPDRRGFLAGMIGAVSLGMVTLGLLGTPAPTEAARGDARWVCAEPECLPYIYDPALGDPDGGIPPGTPFEAIPDGWSCPVCGASKQKFRRAD